MGGDWYMRIKFLVIYNDGHSPDEFIDYTKSRRIYVADEDVCQIKNKMFIIYANGKWTNCDGYTSPEWHGVSIHYDKSHIELLVGEIDKINTIEVFPYVEPAV
jgi:hypothetical protein